MSGGGSKTQTVGYRYYFDIHMGICRGPVDALLQINVDDKQAWPLPYRVVTAGGITFTVTPDQVVWSRPNPTFTSYDAPPPATVSTYGLEVVAPFLFGGDDKEGGLQGTMDIMMGEATQPINPRVQSLVGGGLVSAFRGMLTIFYSGLVTSMNPYPKPWKFRVRRALQGWDGPVFYPERCVITMDSPFPEVTGGPAVSHPIYAMNPAHIVYECLTNRDWGRGASRDLIDDTSFRAAADTLYAEGFGLCLKWTREDTIENFVQQVMDHVGAVLYLSRDTGLFTMKLVRSDYNPDTLPVFTTSTGILSIEEDDQTMPAQAVNELVVSFTDPILGQPREVRVQNIASMQALEAINTKTSEYPGIPTASLALRVAQRDLRVHSADVRKFKFVMDRRAHGFVPGTAFRFTDSARNITDMVLRVGKIEDHSDSSILVYVVEDIFGLSQVSYANYQPTVPEEQLLPTAATTAVLYEANYRDLYMQLTEGDLSALDGTESFVYAVAQRPSSYAYDYKLYSGTDADGYYERGRAGDWTPVGTLTAAITPVTTSFAVTAVSMTATPAIGDVFLCENEIMQVTAYNAGTGMVTVYRGCVDTVPADHPLGARVWITSGGVGADETPYLETSTVRAKILTRTPVGQLELPDAPQISIVLQGRHSRPYPPGQVRVNGLSWYALPPQYPDPVLTWVHRNKVTQGDMMLHQGSSNVTPAAGLTYTIEVRLQSTNALLRTATGISSSTWTYTEALWATDGRPANVRFVLYAVEAGVQSLYPYIIPLTIRDDGWGMEFGNDWSQR